MKKLLSFILVICFLIPMALTFSACEFLNPPNGTPPTTPTTPTVETEETNNNQTQVHPLYNKTFIMKSATLAWKEGTTELQKKQEMSLVGVVSEQIYFELLKSMGVAKVDKLHFYDNGKFDAYQDGAITKGTYTLSNTTLTLTANERTATGTMGNNSFTLTSAAENSFVILTQEYELTTEGIAYPTLSGTYTLESCKVAWKQGVTEAQKSLAISDNGCSTEAGLFALFTLEANSQTLTFTTTGEVTYIEDVNFIDGKLTTSYIENGNTITISALNQIIMILTKTDNKLVCTKVCSESTLTQTLTFVKK